MKLKVTWEKFGSHMDGYVYFARGPVRGTKKQALTDVGAIKQLLLYQEAFYAAKCFIDAHVADPDLTSEMVDAYNKYLHAAEKLNK